MVVLELELADLNPHREAVSEQTMQVSGFTWKPFCFLFLLAAAAALVPRPRAVAPGTTVPALLGFSPLHPISRELGQPQLAMTIISTP